MAACRYVIPYVLPSFFLCVPGRKVESADATETAMTAAKEEASTFASQLERAQAEILRMGEQVKSPDAAAAEGKSQQEKTEEEKKTLLTQMAALTEEKGRGIGELE